MFQITSHFNIHFPTKYTTSISRYTRFWKLPSVTFYLGNFKRMLWEQVVGLGRKAYFLQVANKVLQLRKAVQQWYLLPTGMTRRTKTWSRRHIYQHSPLINSRVHQKWRSHSETEISQAAHPLNYLSVMPYSLIYQFFYFLCKYYLYREQHILFHQSFQSSDATYIKVSVSLATASLPM